MPLGKIVLERRHTGHPEPDFLERRARPAGVDWCGYDDDVLLAVRQQKRSGSHGLIASGTDGAYDIPPRSACESDGSPLICIAVHALAAYAIDNSSRDEILRPPAAND